MKSGFLEQFLSNNHSYQNKNSDNEKITIHAKMDGTYQKNV